MKTHVKALVVGGGAVGTGIAYHLAKAGWDTMLVERDEFGMREDFHLVSFWRYLGTVHNEAALHELLETRNETQFDPDIYRIINKFLKAGKLRVQPLST